MLLVDGMALLFELVVERLPWDMSESSGGFFTDGVDEVEERLKHGLYIQRRGAKQVTFIGHSTMQATNSRAP
jgi:hypothetical protein